MGFFIYHMPPFLNVMGVFYILVAAPILINLLRDGYWRGVFTAIIQLIRQHLIFIPLLLIVILGLINWVDLPFTIWIKHVELDAHAYTFWDFICSCAEGGFVAGLLFTIAMLSDYFKLKQFAQVTKISLMASIYGGLANGVFKFIFNRQRPAIGLDQWHFFAFFQSGASHFSDLMYAYNSMPSGHTISTVAALVPFYICYRHKLVRSLLIWWGLMVCFSRVYTINHWLSDVVFASALGLLIGLVVYQVNAKRLDNVT